MKLIHTLLFLIRKDHLTEDKKTAELCLRSMEKSSYRTLVVYNQGFWSNEEAASFLSDFQLNCIVIGGAQNVGTVIGRQSCFEYIWNHEPDTQYISEIHLDMQFTSHWEDALVEYLDCQDEPMISCGIVDQHGDSPFLKKASSAVPKDPGELDSYLESIRCPQILHGFTNPCIHKSSILKETGGYNACYLRGKHAFEDDSMLLGYYYYYGTKVNWKPKVNYNSVVYHAVAGQRLILEESVNVNYHGLIRQYGGMGLKHLSELHASSWHVEFFGRQSLELEKI